MMPHLIEPLGDLLGNESVTRWAEGSGKTAPTVMGGIFPGFPLLLFSPILR
jgi:hypothetical protein